MLTASRHMLALMAATVMTAHAWAGDGLQTKVDPQAWEGLKARLALGTAQTGRHEAGMSIDPDLLKINSLSLMGDYYLSRPWLGTSGGLRATSGVLLGSRSSIWSSPALMERRASAYAESNEATSTQPYLGVGYTGWSSKGGWGLSADVGLMGTQRLSPRIGKTSANNQSLDDTVRDLRFSPLLQLGLSYSF